MRRSVRRPRVEIAHHRVKRPVGQRRWIGIVRIHDVVTHFHVPARRASSLELRADTKADIRVRRDIRKRITAVIARNGPGEFGIRSVDQLHRRTADGLDEGRGEVETLAVRVRRDELVLHGTRNRYGGQAAVTAVAAAAPACSKQHRDCCWHYQR